MSESVITQEMKDAIGVESDPVVYPIEEGAILRFAEAIGDTNPIFNDKEEASKTKYGGIVAPPTFLRSIAHVKSPEPKIKVTSPYPANVDGGSEWEYYSDDENADERKDPVSSYHSTYHSNHATSSSLRTDGKQHLALLQQSGYVNASSFSNQYSLKTTLKDFA